MLSRRLFVSFMRRRLFENRCISSENPSTESTDVSGSSASDRPSSSKKTTPSEEELRDLRYVRQRIKGMRNRDQVYSTDDTNGEEFENEETDLDQRVIEMARHLESCSTNGTVSVEKEPADTARRAMEKRKLGVSEFRKIIYTDGELDNSDLSKPPSPDNPHPFNPSEHLPPTHARSLAPFVNTSEALQALVELGVNLFEVDTQNPRLGRHIVRLDLERDIKPRLQWLVHDLGFDPTELGDYLTRNPYFLIQNIEDMKTRLNYLESKKFTVDQIRKIIIEFRYWLNVDVKTMDARLGWIQKQFGISGNQVREVIIKEPRVIMFGLGPLQRLVNLLNKELQFTPGELKHMFLTDPRLYMMDAKFVIQNYHFVRRIMALPNEVISRHPFLLRCSLSSIRSRHEFLKHLGRAVYEGSTTPAGESEAANGDSEKLNTEPVNLVDFLHPSNKHFSNVAARSYLAVYEQFLRCH